jgi:hypothetical protein
MKEQFKEINFNASSREMIAVCNDIINRYLKQNLRLTLRQLYYQLVTINYIKNQEKSYKNLGRVLSDARLAGEIDWDAIEDRVRVPHLPNEFNGLNHLIETAVNAYRLPRWKKQDHYIELWVEKDAISGVLEPMAKQYHITLMVNRGYSSQSAMYAAAYRFSGAWLKGHRSEQLLYLGDMDPSGEDMVHDIRNRLEMFHCGNVEVEKIALTMEQVEQYNPPPNPAKTTDSRYESYANEHGTQSWEVDALPPDVLQSLVRENVEMYLDVDKMQAVIKQEKADKEKLLGFVESIGQSDDDVEPGKTP